MSDWRDDEFQDETWTPQGQEGVRVVGDEDPYAPERAPAPAPRGRRRPQRPAAPAPAPRFPLPGGDDASWAGGDPDPQGGYGQGGYDQQGVYDPHAGPLDPTPSGGVNLPHWTEPATGEVPRVLGGSSADDDYENWSQAGAAGPRFRTGDSDWAEGDWGEGEFAKDETMGVAEHDEHGDPDAWGPPPKRRGRGRGRRGRGGAPAEAPPMHTPPPMHRGGLEGPPVPDHFDEYDQHHDDPDQPVDLAPRLITAGVVAAIALVAFAAGRAPAMLLVTAIVGVGALELYTAFQKAGYHPATAVGLLGCVAIVPAAYNEGERAYPLITILVVTFTCLWYMIEVVRARPVVNIGLTLLPFGWVGIFGGFAGLLLAPDPSGTGLLMGVVICAVGCDVAAYFVGRAMGRTPLLPRISPNKTVEGVVGGGITAIVLGAMVGAVLHPWADFGIGAGIVLGILVAVTAPLGDLVESMIKRDLGVKDLGSILPGHGGFLDRFDAILFVLPVAFYWAYHLFTTA